MQDSRTQAGVRPPSPRTPERIDPDVEPTVELRVEDRPAASAAPRPPQASQRPPAAPSAAATSPGAQSGIAAAVQRAHLALGFDQGGGLEERRVSLVLEIDATGAQRTLTQRTVWRATGAGADSFPVFALLPTPVGERVLVEAVEGCTTGPTYADLREGLFATSLVLGRRLAAGEEATTVHRITLPSDATPQAAYEHQLKQYVDDITIEVRFDRELLPSGVGAYVRVGAEEEAVPTETTECSVIASCGGFGPGAAGVRWVW